MFCKRFNKRAFELFWLKSHGKFEFEKKINSNIFNSFGDFEHVCNKEIPEDILAMNLTISNLNFKILKTKNDYNQASDLFSNCIRKYFHRDSFVVIYNSLENRPVACVNFNRNKEVIKCLGLEILL